MTLTDKEKLDEIAHIFREVLEEHQTRMEKRTMDNPMWIIQKILEAAKLLSSMELYQSDDSGHRKMTFKTDEQNNKEKLKRIERILDDLDWRRNYDEEHMSTAIRIIMAIIKNPP